MTGRSGRLPSDGRTAWESVAPIGQIDDLIVVREMFVEYLRDLEQLVERVLVA
jgi:hypothetical protein